MKKSTVLKNARYRRFFIGMTISKLGDWFFLVSLPLLVFDLTNSATSMAMAFVLEFLPQVLFALIGGALADQVNKKKVLVFGDLTSGVIVSFIPLMYYLGHLQVWMLYVVSFALASVTAFYHPSFESIIPEVVEKEEFVQGNSLFRLTDTLMTFIGPAVAGVAISFVGKVNTIFIDSISFLLTSLILSGVGYRYVKRTAERPKIVGPIKEGLRFVVKNEKIMAGSLLIFGINIGFGAVESLFMFYLADYLKFTSSAIGLVLSIQAIGPFVAVYLANRLKHLNRGHMIIFSGFVIGLAQISLFFSQSFLIVLLVCQILIKGSVVLLAINWFTLRQETVPSEMLGRVVSSTRMIAFLAIPFSGMIAGVLANVLNVKTIFVIAGIVCVLCSLISLKSSLFNSKKELVAQVSSNQ